MSPDRNTEFLYGVAAGLSVALMVFGVAVSTTSWSFGVGFFALGIALLIASLGGLHIYREQKQWSDDLSALSREVEAGQKRWAVPGPGDEAKDRG